LKVEKGEKLVALQFKIKTRENIMAKKLYVGGISYSTSNDGLKDAFAQVGEVTSATIIMDKMTGRSKGFGFVEFANDADADAAVAKWNGQELDGRKLTVNEARPMEPRAPRTGGFDRGNDRGGRTW
jgi:cold-inducible RNA-binding protein